MKLLSQAVSEVYDGEVNGGGGGANAIYSRQEVADDVISGEDVGLQTSRYYVCINLWIGSFGSLRKKIYIIHSCDV